MLKYWRISFNFQTTIILKKSSSSRIPFMLIFGDFRYKFVLQKYYLPFIFNVNNAMLNETFDLNCQKRTEIANFST